MLITPTISIPGSDSLSLDLFSFVDPVSRLSFPLRDYYGKRDVFLTNISFLSVIFV